MINKLKVLRHLQDIQGKSIKYLYWSFGNNGSLMVTQENEFLYWELEMDLHWNKPAVKYKDCYDLYKMLIQYCNIKDSDFVADLIEYKIFSQEEINTIIKQ